MNKDSFLALLKDSSKTGKVLGSLEELSNQYPYSQPIRAMMAKGSKATAPTQYQRLVSVAALYAADRSALKEYVEKTRVIGKKTTKIVKVTEAKTTKVKSSAVKKSVPKKVVAAKVKTPEEVKKKPLSTLAKPSTQHADDMAALREEVLHNLEELVKNKKAFAQFIDSDKEGRETPKTKPKRSSAVKTKKQPAAKRTSVVKQKKNSSSGKTNKDELIDQFIEVSPSITPNKAITGNQEDLSIKSVSFNEDLVSENLAQIFAKQGKTKKAIEIYKKLIWKFPQKKAFFAARIEEFKTK